MTPKVKTRGSLISLKSEISLMTDHMKEIVNKLEKIKIQSENNEKVLIPSTLIIQLIGFFCSRLTEYCTQLEKSLEEQKENK